jgi:hypothetical protein
MVKGMLKGRGVILRYDISQGQPQLEINDFLNKQGKSAFSLGTNNFKETGYTLPSQENINNKLIATYGNLAGSLSGVGSFEEVQRSLSTEFETATSSLYERKELVQLTMERQLHKDVAAQTFVPLMQAVKGKTEYTTQNLTEELKTDTDLLNLTRYVDNFLETASIDEIQRFQWCIEQITIKAKNPKSNPHYKVRGKCNHKPRKNLLQFHIKPLHFHCT